MMEFRMMEFVAGAVLSGHSTCPQLDVHTDPLSLQIVNVRYVRDAIVGFALSEAPTDGFVYARRGSNATWQGLTRANNVTALGEGALASLTIGNGNTAVGFEALNSLTTGGTNTAVGSGALRANNTTGSNTAVGFNALAANHTWGAGNTAVGASALAANVSGTANTAIGTGALGLNVGGIDNTAVGNAALGQTIAGGNTAVGRSALSAINQSGSSDNVAVGSSAASNFGGGGTTANLARTVSRSVFLGAVAQPQGDGQTNQIVIGANAIGRGSNTVTLGDSGMTQLWLGNSRVWPVEYSTEERVVGVWVDGSPVYQRTWIINNTETNTYPHGVSFGTVIACSAFSLWGGNWDELRVFTSPVNFYLWAGGDFIITLRYTKSQN